MSLGFRESQDVQAALEFIEKNQQLRCLPIAAVGESLGAAAIVLALRATHKVEAIVLEACFSSLEQAVERRCRWLAGPWYRELRDWSVTRLERQIGCSIQQISPLDWISEMKRPLLLIHDQLDWGVSKESSLHLFEKAKSPKKLWLAPYSFHVSSAKMAPKEYRRQLRDFFDKHLG